MWSVLIYTSKMSRCEVLWCWVRRGGVATLLTLLMLPSCTVDSTERAVVDSGWTFERSDIGDATSDGDTSRDIIDIRSDAAGDTTADAQLACTYNDVCGPDDDGDGVPDLSDNCPEIANSDQYDRDRNGVGDVCDNTHYVSEADAIFEIEAPERVGPMTVAGLGDINSDGWPDFAIGLPEPGRVFIFYGDRTFNGTIDLTSADVTLRPPGEERGLGIAIDSLGDVNGDDVDDFIVMTPANPRAEWGGAAYLFLGKEQFPRVLTTDQANVEISRFWYLGDATLYSGTRIGRSVAGLGDVNGDGFNDWAIGSLERRMPGRVDVFLGGPTLATHITLEDSDATLWGIEERDAAGYSIDGLDDVDGDGLDEILIGAPHLQTTPPDHMRHGGALIVRGRAVWPSELSLNDAWVYFEGLRNSASGTSVANAGDVTGDGLSDILIGAPSADGAPNSLGTGRAFIVPGAATYESRVYLGDGITELYSNDLDLGVEVASAGDMDGDGLADMVVGGASSKFGTVSFLSGRPSFPAEIDLSQEAYQVYGTTGLERVGVSLASPGDINGDGYSDVLIGRHTKGVLQRDTMRVYLFYGPVE